MDTPLRARLFTVSGKSILSYCNLLTCFLILLVLLSSFTSPVFKKQIPAITLDKLGLTSSTQAAGAYSLRLLSSDYSGPLMRIAIGSSFYDVYPDASTDHAFSLTSPVSSSYSSYNAPQTGATGTALNTIIGSNSATVAIWYDQSGNARNSIQSNQALQPQVINAGTLILSNGKPTLKYTGSQWLVVTTTAFNSDLSGAVVFNPTNNNIASGAGNTWYTMNGILGSEQPGDVADFGYGIYGGNFTAGFGSPDMAVNNGFVVGSGTTNIFTWTRKSSNGAFEMYANSKPKNNTNVNAGDRTSVNSVAIGSITVNGGGNFNGSISEMVLFPLVFSTAERQAVENSQSAYFNVQFLSSDATLSSLSVTGLTLSPAFDTNTPNYTADVKSNVSSFTVKAVPNFPTAEVAMNGNLLSPGGETTIQLPSPPSFLNFRVIAQDNTQKNYYINLNKIPVPEVSYGTQVLALNKPGTVTPTAANVAAYGYGGYSVFAGDAQNVKSAKKDSQGNTIVLNSINQLFKYFANGDPRIQLLPSGRPNAISLDTTDNLYIIDNADNSFKKVAAGTSNVTTIAAGIGTFDKLAVANDGTAYMINIADNVVKVLPKGSSTLEDMNFDGLVNPYDVAVNNKGDVYVSDSSNGQVLVYYKSDDYVDLLYNFSPVTAITIDNNNNLYGAAVDDGTIYEFPSDYSGQRTVLSGDDYKQLKGFAIDTKGVLFLISGLRMGVTQVIPTGGYFIDKQLPDGLILNPTTGAISGTPTQIVTSANYSITAYNAVEGDAGTLTLKVLQDNANLSAIVSNDITLSQIFDANVIDYTANARSTSSSIQIAPVAAATDAVITYNGNTIVSGSPITIPISNGINSVVFAVTSPYGTTKNYSITITRVGAPTLSYSNTVNLALNTTIDPVSPASANIEAFGYNKITNYPVNTGTISGIKIDSAGNLYAITSSYKIKKYPADGSAAVDITTSGLMYSFTLDEQNNIYYNDLHANDIKRVDAVTGTETTIATDVQNAYSIVDGKDGYIYFAQSSRNLVNKVAKTGGVITQIGTGFSGPDKLAFDAAGNLYVGDHYNNQVKKVFLSTDSHIEVLPNFSGQPGAIGFDKANNLFVSDYQFNKLFQYSSFGSSSKLIASGNVAQSILGIDFDKKGVIYTISPGSNVIKVLTPTGGYFIDKLLPKGLTFDEETGIISGTPTEIMPATPYSITAYGAFESITSNITIAVKTNLNLTNLLTDVGALTPIFDADSTNYKITVDNGTTSANITATLSEASNSLTINGIAATSGTTASVALNAGDNAIPVVVTSPVDNSAKTYTVKIHRISNDYKLHNLTVSRGSLSPSFNADVFGYTVDLPYGTSSAKLTPTADTSATIKVDEILTASGDESQSLSLHTGDNNINVHVIAEDGTSAAIYVVKLRVAGPSSVSLSDLTLSAGTLNPAFSAGNTNYQVSVPVGTSTLTVHPVVEDALSVATVNGSALDGTSGSVNVSLNDGINVIAVAILANDGTTMGSYTITVNKLIPAPTNSPLTAQVYNTGIAITPLATGFGNVAAPGYFALADTLSKAIPTPTGIAINKAGDLFVADITAGAVYKIAAGGGAPVAILTGLNTPLGVATDAVGNVYAAALGNNNIKKITPDGTITSLGSGLSFPTGLAVDATGNIYVDETANHAVKKITPAGITTTFTTDLTFPYGIAVDANYIYVSDNSTGTIERFNLSDGAKTTLMSNLVNPTDVKTDAAGNIYVNQGGVNIVTKFDKTGSNPVTISTGYTGLFGLAIGKDGKLYITDNGRQTIEKISPSGGYYLSDALPDGLVFDTATGIISGTPTTASEAKNYTITAYNSGGNAASVVNISVLANTDLANLAISSGTLDPEFNSTTTTYAVSVPFTVSSLTVTPTVTDVNATVTVNGTATTSGTASAAIPLDEDINTIPVIVTGRDNVATKQYSVAVTRRPALVQVSFILDPLSVFVKTTGTSNYNYITGVSPAISSIRIKPTTHDADAVIIINGQAVGNATFSNPITLNAGPTVVEVVVKKSDVIVSTYTITVNHNASNNALAGLALDPPSLFVRTTGAADVNYTTSVAPGITSVRLKANAQQQDAVIRINGDLVTSGTFSNPIALNAGPTVINVSVTAQDGVTVNDYAVTVNHNGSNNAKLSLALNPSSVLITTTGTSTYNYSTSVASDVTSISVKPTAQQENALIRVNGDLVTNGAYSNPISLNIGATVINVSATAQDGVTVSTYSITVTRTGSNNAKVSLALNPSSVLATTTGTSTYNYVTSVSPEVSSISVKPTAQQANAVISVNGNIVNSGTYSDPIALNIGATVINVSVTAQDGVTVNTFSIKVNRTGSNNAKVGLALNPSSVLTTVTGTSTYNYVTSVSAAVTSVSVRPTAQQADAVIRVNGNIVASGALSAPILLDAGATVIKVSGTAQDGVTVNTYSITVNRTGSNNAKVSLALNPASELVTTNGTSTYNYITSVSPGVSSISIKPTAQQADAVIKVNNNIVSSGTYSGPIALNEGPTLIIVSVTAQDGVTVNTFSVTVNRTGSSNVSARIALNPVTTLTSTTGPGNINYLANVGEGQSTIRVIPTVYDNATATVNGVAVTGGTASDPVSLTPGGSTLITIVVTEQNGYTTKTYTVNVNRPSSILLANRNDTNLLLAGKTGNNVAPTGDDGVVVHQGVSPNGDGSNDFLYIEGISAYPGNKLSIMNTAGTLVFEAKDYGNNGNNMFDGHSKTGTLLKPGTYFYALEYQVNKQAKRKTGYIIIKY